MQSQQCKVAIMQDESLYAELQKERVGKQYTKNFLAMITHEFRNPLHGILGIFQNLLDNLSNKVSELFIGQCQMGIGTVKLMMRLVNDLLDISQLDSGNFSLLNEEAEIEDLVKECVELMQFKYKTKGVSLIYKIVGRIPKLSFDKNRYKQVLINLLGNAIKFTEKGQVVIRISYDNDKKHLHTRVKDSGIGIKDSDKDKLFKFFGKLEDPDKINPQGAGLGLYICKRLVEAMGGRIHLCSEYKKGTIINFGILNHYVPENGIEIPQITISIPTERQVSDDDSMDNNGPQAKYYTPYTATTQARINSQNLNFSKISEKPGLVIDDELICATAVSSYLKSCKYDADIVFFEVVEKYNRHLQVCKLLIW